MYRNKALGIVVPTYNEERLILDTLKGIPSYADKVYVVNDASTDTTVNCLEGVKDSRIILVNHMVNRGVGAAIASGYKKALSDGMDIVAVMAGDNQMDAKYLPGLLNPIVEHGIDYTKGNRLSKRGFSKGMSVWRFCGNWVLSLTTKIVSGYWHIGDSQNGYTAISKRALRMMDLDKLYHGYGYCNELLVRLNVAGCKALDVPIPAKYGKEKSKIQYLAYILTLTGLLICSFVWRIYLVAKDSKMLDSFVEQFTIHAPDSIFAFLYNITWAKYRHTEIKRSGKDWLICGMEKGDSSLLSPTAKFLNVKYKDYDAKMNRCRYTQIQAGDIALDVGGCIGDTGIFMRRQVGCKGKLIIIEPDATNVKYLRLNFDKFANVVIVPKAAWNKRETMRLYTHRTLTGHSLEVGWGRDGCHYVETDTIDNMVEGIRINFAKIDVQGSEVAVLQGAKKLLEYCPKVIVETHFSACELKTYPKVLEIMHSYGYKTEFVLETTCVYAWK